MLTKEKVKEILEETFGEYVRVDDADVQKVYDGFVELLGSEAVEHSVQRIGDGLCPECGKLGGSHLWSCKTGDANR